MTEEIKLERVGSHWQNSNLQIQAWIANKAHTIWEKYRLLCNQLENRKQALGQVKASEKRRQAKLAKFAYLQEHGTKWEKLEAEAEMLEAEAGQSLSESCIQAAQQEVEFIESLIKQLEPQLERDRIPGYSDEQMFQHCQEEEWAKELLHRAENYYISRIFGGFPPEQIDAMRSHPQFESRILPELKQMHREFLPAIATASTLQMPSTNNNIPKITAGENLDGRGTQIDRQDS
jgi:hypothetical protein